MKLLLQILFLVLLSILTAIYMRSQVASNMQKSWFTGCNEGALKLDLMKNDTFLYNFCKARLKIIQNY